MMSAGLGRFIVFVLIFMVLMAGCTVWESPLPSAEVREYQGERLSSIHDFRENSIFGPQQVDIATYRLKITGLVDREVSLTYREIIEGFSSHQKVVTLHCVEGWDVTILWNGVLLSDLLVTAGVRSEAKIAIFYAADGFTTTLPLDYLQSKQILLAYQMNGLTLPANRGFPFQLVAEAKYGYKWIKWVTKVELSDNLDYRGYYEIHGFSNEADVPQENTASP
jgi:DMSO/TMAO reductase YedYZ molybdopterin-dependent catalytic subunit